MQAFAQTLHIVSQLTQTLFQAVKALFHLVKALVYVAKALVYVAKALVYVDKTLVHKVKTLVHAFLKAGLSLFQVSHAVGQAVKLAGKIDHRGQTQSQYSDKKSAKLQPDHVLHIFHICYHLRIMFATLLSIARQTGAAKFLLAMTCGNVSWAVDAFAAFRQIGRNGFCARKTNFFAHKHFASMLFRFFIPRLRAGRATQCSKFWFLARLFGKAMMGRFGI